MRFVKTVNGSLANSCITLSGVGGAEREGKVTVSSCLKLTCTLKCPPSPRRDHKHARAKSVACSQGIDAENLKSPGFESQLSCYETCEASSLYWTSVCSLVKLL